MIMPFPQVTGSSLTRRTYHLPGDFAGDLNLVFIAFLRIHQNDIDAWIPPAKELTTQYERLRYYELPVIRPMNFLARGFIDGGMRMGIPNRSARAATITLYLEKEPFRQALQIRNENVITVVLVDPAGTIYWRETGPFTEEKGDALRQAVATFFAA